MEDTSMSIIVSSFQDYLKTILDTVVIGGIYWRESVSLLYIQTDNSYFKYIPDE